ncbi:hypothetical protein QP185_17580 [Sphingomonas aerolata]|uniref:hypothetical protein n=1 Tax=Sphingomonas aerolata TaxID=185951 RepID=UPI002FE15506
MFGQRDARAGDDDVRRFPPFAGAFGICSELGGGDGIADRGLAFLRTIGRACIRRLGLRLSRHRKQRRDATCRSQKPFEQHHSITPHVADRVTWMVMHRIVCRRPCSEAFDEQQDALSSGSVAP